MPRRVNNNAPQRPRRCGLCSMFGHDRRGCHLNQSNPNFPQDAQYQMAMANWRLHCDINAGWVAQGGAGHDVPEPQPPKTPFELACENKCKITKADECCICMEALGEKNTTTTACGHQFHFGCLAQHTCNSNKCPMCRAVICPEPPKREIHFPPSDAILRASARATAGVVTVMEELSMGDDMSRRMIGEAIAMMTAQSHASLIDAIRTVNQ